MQQRSGFSLIELSIVLIIIGLIVAGVMGGQSLVNSARLQKVVKDISQYATAFNAFKSQYNALPGDFAEGYAYFANGSNATCGSDAVYVNGCNGNGNGILGDGPGFDGKDELMRAWRHLALAEIIPWKPQYVLNYVCTLTKIFATSPCDNYTAPTIPPSPFANTGYMVTSSETLGNHQVWQYGTLFGQAGYWLTLVQPANNYTDIGQAYNLAYSYFGALTPANAKQIDKKLDDGLPTSGKVLGFWEAPGPVMGLYCTNPWINPGDTPTNHNSYQYNVTLNATGCALAFKIGSY